ncbi:hypothetical protein AN958_01906 [Leucoagaricus sp. SymC.cos]|nr:hypothetical protein AN958_01906 [Leucoagaricus sp. SymC.cos]
MTLFRSSSRIQPPSVNLKERIAALQQRTNAPHSSTSSSPSSPSPNATPSSNQTSTSSAPASASALREKIARFEKKGGVPVPRGSFGLGAPPLPDPGAPKRKGELYGNRIPQPVRVVSGPQRAVSPLGHNPPPRTFSSGPGAAGGREKRRSFSLSNVSSIPDFSSDASGTPLTSPSESSRPESPALSTTKPTSQLTFASALEFARSVENASKLDQALSPLPPQSSTEADAEATISTSIDTITTNTANGTMSSDVHTHDNTVANSDANADTDTDKAPSATQTQLNLLPPSSSSSPLSPPQSSSLAPATPSPSLVPSAHKLPRAVGFGSPPTEMSSSQPLTPEVVLSDDEGVGPGVAIAPGSPPLLLVESVPVISLTQVKDEEEGKMKEHVLKKSPPPAPELDGVSLPVSPPIPSDAPASSQLVQDEDDNSTNVVSIPQVQVQVRDDDEKDVEDEIQMPSSPTTPHASAFTLSSPPPTQNRNHNQLLNAHLSPSQSSASFVPPPILIPEPEAPIRPTSMVEFTSTPKDSHSTARTREREDAEEERGEPGSVTILTGASGVQQRPATTTFKAVVHHKTREVPTMTRFTDLTDLLQSTVLLEQTLESGALPSDTSSSKPLPVIVTDEDDTGNHNSHIEVQRLSREELEENQRTLNELRAKREEQAKSKIRNTLRNGFGFGGGRMREAGVIASMYEGVLPPQQQQQFYSKRFRSPSVPHLLDSARQSQDVGGFGVGDGGGEGVGMGGGGELTRLKTPESQIGGGKPPSIASSSKSPKSRFPSFRRLASRSSPSSSKEGHVHGYPRNSVSTSSEISSSEDSAIVAATLTPPDNALEFGETWPKMSTSSSMSSGSGSGKKTGQYAALGHGKEGGGHMARAATFAGKIWQRARTKSGASMLSVHSSSGRLSSEPPPALPPLPYITLPLSGDGGDSSSEDIVSKPPTRSTSLYPHIPSAPTLPPLPPKSSDFSFDMPADPSRSITPQPTPRFSISTNNNHNNSHNSLSPDSPSSLYLGCSIEKVCSAVVDTLSYLSLPITLESFDADALEAHPGWQLMDQFSDCIQFTEFSPQEEDINVLCILNAELSQALALDDCVIVATDASVGHDRAYQAVSAAWVWAGRVPVR